eukprot:7899950-Prorocentrum_lima.AAC.1
MMLSSNATGKKKGIGPCSRLAKGRVELQGCDTGGEIQPLVMLWSQLQRGELDCAGCGKAYID